MVFSSLIFLFFFLPVTLSAYYISPRRLKNPVLLISSLIFYGWGEPVYIMIMIFSTVFDYTNGILIDKFRHRKRTVRAIFIMSVTINLGLLCFFKYYGFILQNINSVTGLAIPVHVLPLPIGISFYTFQTMSYVIDVYLDKVPVQRNIISFGTYITMFPQLVAGPIVKYGDVKDQLSARKESLVLFGEGVEIFLTGLGKKVLLANNIGMLWDTVKNTPAGELSMASAWLGIIAFTFQIYFDFSGYSDMAVGLGKMFGFRLMANFDYPYISRSVTEFWRRWHISLGSWFREYIYIPLGGNRAGRYRQYANLTVVWFLTGLWHGASWNFIFWGLYFGFFIILEKSFLLDRLTKGPRLAGHIYTLLVVVMGWVLFEFEELTRCGNFFRVLFGFGSGGLLDRSAVYMLYNNISLFILLFLFSTPLAFRMFSRLREKLKAAGSITASVLYSFIFLLATAGLVSDSYNPFLYFRF